MLPPRLEVISVPPYFPASGIGYAIGCRLRFVETALPLSEVPDRLPAGPEASIGLLMHKVLERASQVADLSLEEIFDSEYNRTIEEIVRDPKRCHFAKLALTKSRSEWITTKSRILSQ